MTAAEIVEIWIEEAEKERKTVALVEGLQKDEAFWQDMFDFYTEGKVSLDFPFATKGGKTGKDAFKPYYSLLNTFSGRFVICRDSDIEHLYNKEVERLFQTPYLFHTHSYSIENHKCLPKNLAKICKEITSKEYDFQLFMNTYSEITYRFLIIYIGLQEEAYFLPEHIKSNGEKGEDVSEEINKWTTISQLWQKNKVKNILKYDKNIFSISALDHYWCSLKTRISEYEKEVKRELISQNCFENMAAIDAKLAVCEEKYAKKIAQTETYHYLNGHILFDEVIKPLFYQVKEALITQKESELPAHIQQEYRNKAYQVDVFTRLDISYKQCFVPPNMCHFLQKIGNDIQAFY